MGSFKQHQIEEEDLRAHLCEVCQDRQREVECARCGELTVCRWCLDQGASSLCSYCEHVTTKR